MVSVPGKNSIKNELMEAETVTEYPEENCESTIEDFGVYETEVKEEIISEFDTDDIVNDPNYFDQEELETRDYEEETESFVGADEIFDNFDEENYDNEVTDTVSKELKSNFDFDQQEKSELRQFSVKQIQEKVKNLCRKRKQPQTF